MLVGDTSEVEDEDVGSVDELKLVVRVDDDIDVDEDACKTLTKGMEAKFTAV